MTGTGVQPYIEEEFLFYIFATLYEKTQYMCSIIEMPE
jgi:hypothetical protein